MKLEFYRRVLEKKFRPVVAKLFLSDGQKDGWTDMTKIIVAVRNFANAPKKDLVYIMKVCKLSDYE
jgi:hypothetical protein